MKKNIYLSVILLMALLIPSGMAVAGSDRQIATPTAVDSASSTPAAQTTPTASQTPEPTPVKAIGPIPETTEVFTFQDFGHEEVTMRGPFAANGYYFDLPLTWSMKDGAMLRLVLDVFYNGTTADNQNIANATYGGTLLVQYNYITIGSIDLDRAGPKQVEIPIPLDVLTRLGSNKGHSIQLLLDSNINCNVNFRTTVVVRTDSQLFFPHDMIDPPVDLRSLPSPFYQNSFNQDTAIIVVPNQPSAEELQAALSISAGFGRMTYNRILISLIPVSQLSTEILNSNNLIFVGLAKGFPLLEKVPFPAPVSGGVFAAKDAIASDGIVQMAVSPWNKTKVVMSIGGNEDKGVVSAARAVSTGALQVGANPGLSLVSSVQLAAPLTNPTDVNQTFEDLGYDSIVVSETGLNTVNYIFNIPQNYILGPDANLDLVFSHTALLEYQRSTIVVKLNDQPIGSVRLSDETIGQGTSNILLPASAARPGSNNLRLEIELEPRNECVNPLLNGLWMRIDSSSSLHLPFVPNPASTSSILFDLSRYPSPFAFDPTMADLGFVLSPNDPIGWNIATQIALSLGYTNAVQLAALEAYYADNVPDAARQERNLIIIGKPSKLEILSELYDALPAPFERGTDLAIEKNLQVTYRLGAGVDVGYLELLSAPWNPKRTILYVGGSSDLGLKWAGTVLQLGRLRSKLNGNLAFINDEQVITADTRLFQLSAGMLPAIANNLTPDVPVISEPVVVQPPWILPVILISLGGIVLVLIILGVQVVWNRRVAK